MSAETNGATVLGCCPELGDQGLPKRGNRSVDGLHEDFRARRNAEIVFRDSYYLAIVKALVKF